MPKIKSKPAGKGLPAKVTIKKKDAFNEAVHIVAKNNKRRRAAL